MKSRVDHAAEIATPDRDENARPCLRENGRALRRQHRRRPKNSRDLRAVADEMSASHLSSHSLPTQHRHPVLSAPRHGNGFGLGRLIRPRSDIGEKSRAPWLNPTQNARMRSESLINISRLAQIIA